MKTFPKHSFTINGGCNCGAVRYKVNVPPFEDRKPNPYRTPGADIGDLRIPCTFIDHCNDCRRATSSVLPMALVTDITVVEAAVLSDPQHDKSKSEPTWQPAAEVFDFTSEAHRTGSLSLKFYKSTPGRCRWFCGTCGTMVAYTVDDGQIPSEWGWPKMLDIWLGTVDREDLEKDWMAPERMMWCEKGVPWIRELARHGAGGVPEHPLTKIDVLVDEQRH